MSELIQKNDNRATIRWKLLTGASALALAAYVSSASVSKAEDAKQPQLWIELGGQLSRLQDAQDPYAPTFVALTPSIFPAPTKTEQPPLFGMDENAALNFRPDGSDWSFSASIRYGRASSGKHVRHQSHPDAFTQYSRFHRAQGPHATQLTKVTDVTNTALVTPRGARFTDVTAKDSETHTILDFQAGKDLGLGLFGHDAPSTLSVGVRIAQFRSKSRDKILEDPDWHFQTQITTFSTAYYRRGKFHSFFRTNQRVYQPYHSFAGNFQASRSFKGVGPSIAWKSSVPFAGNPQDGGLSMDWGVNAALLFGRQRTRVHHHTTAHYHSAYNNPGYGPFYTVAYQHHTPVPVRSRNVTVPNVGGFAGISWNYTDAKVSLGYRADFFFNAIDDGIDAAKKQDRGFYGPYASISIGLGD